MASLFLKLFNMSMAASWLILAVIVLRLVLKRAPKWIHCVLWALVAVRLLCPISIESALSLIPSSEPLPPEVVQFDPHPAIHSGVTIIDNAVNPVIGETFAASPEVSVNPLYVWTEIAGIIWAIGVVALLAYAAVSYFRLRRVVSESAPLWDNIYLCDHIQTPFILGLFRPRVYLPSDLSDAQMQSVVAHERAHLARHDHWWKPLGWALLTVYWFNPLCWVAYILLCRDIELACDEKVIRDMDVADRKAYSQVLLSCSIPRRLVSACPLAFGEVGVKERIQGVLNYKKPAFWVIALAVIACIAAAVCFLTNPKASDVPDGIELADLDGDGGAEQFLMEELTPDELYSAKIIRTDGSTLWEAELGLPHTVWTAFFLYQDDDTAGILEYNPAVFQGEADYYYRLYVFPHGLQTTAASNSVSFDTNPDSADPWPPEAAAFAEEVNQLLSHSTLLISTLDGELRQYGDAGVWRCDPIATQTASAVDVMGMPCWYVEEETAPHFITRSYYTKGVGGSSNVSAFIAESFGFEIDDYVVDVDGDGVTELVCNCQYGGDGHESVYVFRRNGNILERGWLDLENKQLDMVMPANWKNWGINSTAERYNPDTGMFEVRYDTDHGTETVTVSHLEHFTFTKYMTLPSAIALLPTPITAENLFASMPSTFHFLSGAGGWQTELYWYGNGKFSGIFEDADAGSIARCEFVGAVDAPTQISDLEFSVHVKQLDYDKPGITTKENGIPVTTSGPYGLDDADELRIYLPGYPVSKLPEEAVNWLRGGVEEFWDGKGPDTLPFFVLYNVRQQQAFFSADWSAFQGTDDTRLAKTVLTVVKEGTEFPLPAVHYTDLGYSLYVPQEGWQYQRALENDMLVKRWISEDNPDVSLTIRKLGYRDLAAAQDWERTHCSKFSLVEDKQGGLFGEYNQNLLDIQFYQRQNTMYAVELRYPMYATEGFGAELQVIRDTFQITK